jgi:endonuclease G
MQFDITTGAISVTVNHAKYGSDGSSTRELWMSENGGAN